MGYLRILLALSVLFGHIPNGFQLVGGQVAVEAFFMISGFYIARILNHTYANNIHSFYINRLLRLFPAYWFVGIVIFGFLIIDSNFLSRFDSFGTLPADAKIFVVATNIFLVFQDWTMFLGIINGSLQFVENFRNSDPQLFNFLLIPQAWSLGVELTFYAMAPWLCNFNTRLLLQLIGLALILRLLFVLFGIYYDPWTYRFFPTELVFFLTGVVAYRWHEKKKVGLAALSGDKWVYFVILITLIYSIFPFGRVMMWIYYILLFVSLPALFTYSSRNKIDRYIGELSYPIYLVHMLLIELVGQYLNVNNVFFTDLLVAVLSIVAALVIHIVIEKPVERFRNSIRPAVLVNPGEVAAK